MRSFECICGNRVYFENTGCQVCGRTLGYLPDVGSLVAIEPRENDHWQPLPEGTNGGALYRKCANYEVEDVCNWMVPADDSNAFCHACRLNRIIPDLTVPENWSMWFRIEQAKRRLIYTLDRLALPVFGKDVDAARGLAFKFLRDPETEWDEFSANLGSEHRILTGHRSGVITINIAEADPGKREHIREQMAEAYRTLLGHFRHEIAHYYWDLFVRDSRWVGKVRELFGDEREDYSTALSAYYRDGPVPDWPERHISAYASVHPWEDWAETWAHYMHMFDTLETAGDFRLSTLDRAIAAPASGSLSVNDSVFTDWASLTTALNALNRSMGLPDAYPFAISPLVADKLGLVDEIIANGRREVSLPLLPTRIGASPKAPA